MTPEINNQDNEAFRKWLVLQSTKRHDEIASFACVVLNDIDFPITMSKVKLNRYVKHFSKKYSKKVLDAAWKEFQGL